LQKNNTKSNIYSFCNAELDSSFSFIPVIKKLGVAGALPVYLELLRKTNFLEPKGYINWLATKNPDLAAAVKNCCKKWFKKYYCIGDGGHLLLRHQQCKKEHFCFICSDRYTNLRVNHAYETLKEFANKMGFSVYLIHIVFTLPKELWLKAIEKPNLFVSAIYKTLEHYKRGNELYGGVLGIHLNHSRNPSKGYYPQIHCILINVAAKFMPVITENGIAKPKKKKEAVIYFKRKKPFFREKLLKFYYKYALKEVFNFECDKNINLYIQYVKFSDKNEKKIKHLLRYVFRLPIQDFKDFNFINLTEEESNFIWQLLNFRIKRIRWFGFLGDGVKSHYLEIAGVDYVTILKLKWKFKKESNICPIHHIKMLYLGYSEFYYDLNGAG